MKIEYFLKQSPCSVFEYIACLHIHTEKYSGAVFGKFCEYDLAGNLFSKRGQGKSLQQIF